MWWFLGEAKTELFEKKLEQKSPPDCTPDSNNLGLGLFQRLAEVVGSRGSNNTPTCECGRPMALRQGKNGAFYECSGFPQCRKTKDLNEVAEEEVKVEKILTF